MLGNVTLYSTDGGMLDDDGYWLVGEAELGKTTVL